MNSPEDFGNVVNFKDEMAADKHEMDELADKVEEEKVLRKKRSSDIRPYGNAIASSIGSHQGNCLDFLGVLRHCLIILSRLSHT